MIQKLPLCLLVCSALYGAPALAARLEGTPGPTLALGVVALSRPESVPSQGRSRFDAGGLLEVRWSGLPGSAREVELLLSVDGGRAYSLRLTDELDPKGGTYFWRIPSLKTDRARLAIRMGVNGREAIAAVTPDFEISPDPSAARIRLRWHSGEMWTSSSEDSERDDPEPGRGLSGASENMTGLPEFLDAVEVPSRAAQRSGSVRRRPREFCMAQALRGRSFEPPRSSPQATPQRI